MAVCLGSVTPFHVSEGEHPLAALHHILIGLGVLLYFSASRFEVLSRHCIGCSNLLQNLTGPKQASTSPGDGRGVTGWSLVYDQFGKRHGMEAHGN